MGSQFWCHQAASEMRGELRLHGVGVRPRIEENCGTKACIFRVLRSAVKAKPFTKTCGIAITPQSQTQLSEDVVLGDRTSNIGSWQCRSQAHNSTAMNDCNTMRFTSLLFRVCHNITRISDHARRASKAATRNAT